MKTVRVVVALVPLAVSAILALSGCVSRIDPSYDVLHPGSTPEQALPALTLTRRVVPLRGKQRTAMWAGWNEVDAESRSRFGASGEVADPRCIVDGIQAAFPAAVIVPTSRFWSEVAPGRETVALEEVFQEPIWTRLRSLPADVLIAAYHHVIDVETFVTEFVLHGGINDKDREIAALAAFDVGSRRLLHAAQTRYEDMDVLAHLFIVIPAGHLSEPSVDPCEMLAIRAAPILDSAAQGSPLRVVVVAAQEDPLEASRTPR